MKIACRALLALFLMALAGAVVPARAEILVSSWEGRSGRYDEGTGAYLGDFTTSSLVTNAGVEYGPDGKLYVAEWSANRVRRFFPDGTLDSSFSCAVTLPNHLTFDSAGTVYVANFGDPFSLHRCAPDGTALSSVGSECVNGAY